MDKIFEILIIDDEIQMRKLLEITLQSNGYSALKASNAKEGKKIATENLPDMILLDLGLPDQHGHDVLNDLRKWYTNPIVIISVVENEEDIIKALDNGANDYLTKPFRTGELLARIRSALRENLNTSDSIYNFKDLSIDPVQHTVKQNNNLVKLTVTEFNLLLTLVRNEGKVVTHQYLLREVWGAGFLHQSQYLRVFIAQLRKKIEKDPNRPQYILTESGIGYRFVDLT